MQGLVELEELKIVQEAKELQLVQEAKELQLVQETKELQLVQEAKELQLVQETKELQIVQETKELQIVQETKELQIVQEAQELQTHDKNVQLQESNGPLQDSLQDNHYMRLAFDLSAKAIPTPTAYCVGAVLVKDNRIISTGFSREIEGNTHAEQVCLLKLSNPHTAKNSTIYTTMEPCGLRLSGNVSCSSLIISHGIKRVVYGIREPSTLVKNPIGLELLQTHNIVVEQLSDYSNTLTL
jgi:pyrimidine deaminase RibD-like protein